MRVYFTPARLYTGGALTTIAPDTVVAQTTAGVAIESLAYATDADGDFYVDTTNTLYTASTKYQLLVSSTVAGTAVSRTHPFTHVTPTTADLVGPAAPSVGAPAVSEDEASFPVTPPADSDYHHTTVFMVPVGGGTVLSGQSASATATSVTVTGLASNTSYVYIALAYDDSGNPSAVGGYALGTAITTPASTIDYPALVKWFINDEVDYHEFGPEEVDPTAGGSQRIPDLGRGREISVLIECQEPVERLTIRSLGVWATVPGGMPGGLRDDVGT